MTETTYSEPGIDVSRAAIDAMAERGIDISREYPKPRTDEVVRAADVVVTMGCGDACPIFPGTRYENWELDDPAGKTVEEVRLIRDEIERRVRHPLDQLDVPVTDSAAATRRRLLRLLVVNGAGNGRRAEVLHQAVGAISTQRR
jgi:Low molecular weight phosphotyrosine protein phosphatase